LHARGKTVTFAWVQASTLRVFRQSLVFSVDRIMVFSFSQGGGFPRLRVPGGNRGVGFL
jgi:hypothetical protein